MRYAIILAAIAITMTGCIGGLMSRFMGPDPADQYIENLQVMYFVQFHDDPAVGQWAIHKNAMGETWYGIVGGESGAWLVEKREPVPGQDLKVATLMEVDDKGMVQQAWAAKYDPEAEEKPEAKKVKVMPKTEQGDATGEATDAPKPEWSEEKIKGMACDKMTLDKTVAWYSDAVYFAQMMEHPNPKGGTVKMTYDGNVTQELIEQGKQDDLEPSMEVPEEE